VQANNQEITVTRSTLSDSGGSFAFLLLPRGTYRLTVTKDGFLELQVVLYREPTLWEHGRKYFLVGIAVILL